jgi:hypothetical protein
MRNNITAKELAKQVTEQLNDTSPYDLDDIIDQAKEAEVETAQNILTATGIPDDQQEQLLKEMDGMILFVPKYYKLVTEVER